MMATTTYKNRKVLGLCIDCGKNPAESGVRCKHCKSKANHRNRERRKKQRKELRSSGLCLGCATPTAASYCQACRIKFTQYRKQRQENRPPETCSCGEKSVPNKRSCQKCLDRAKARKANIPLGYCKTCAKPTESKKTICDACLAKRRQRRQQIKLEVLEYYGGSPARCECCGEQTLLFLTIDHINGGGNQHRKSFGNRSYIFYQLLYKTKPTGYRVLCRNCNYGTYANNGICPHQQ